MDTNKNRQQDILKKKLFYVSTAVFPGLIVFILLLTARLVRADGTYQTLPFSQNWTNTGLITTNDVWTGVPGIEGYRGDGLTSANDVDAQTVLASDSPGVIDVNANQTNPDTFTTGGATEFDITDDVVALTGSGTADAPYLLIYLNTTGQSGIQVSYNLRDLDGSVDNSAQQIALHYRVGTIGSFTNVPAAYVADATAGPSLSGLVTPVNVTLPAAVDNQSQVQLRIMTTNATGNDEWVGIDDISITTGGADTAPSVSSTSPVSNATNVAVDANITVNFSEGVSVSGNWYGISCGSSGAHSAAVSGGPTSYTLDPTVDFDYSETCTVTITGTLVTDTDSNDPPDMMSGNYVWSFTTEDPPPPPLSIHDIQGATHISPYVGQSVTISPSIVTAIRSNGFYMQELNPDGDDATSEGMFVFTNSAPTVAVGDNVSVSGVVVEFRAGGSSSTNLTITEISGPTVSVNSSGNPLPAATVIGSGGRVPPTAVIDDDATGDVELSGTFDEATDGIDFYESLESMYVQINNAVATGPTNSFGEISVLSDGGAGATLLTPSGGIIIQPGDFNPERVILDDVIATSEPLVHVGDAFSASLVGVLDYSFGNFKFLPTSWPAVVSGGLTREVAPAAATDELTIASFNVENLDPSDGAAKFNALADLIVNNLQSPDIIAVEEIQDNSGPISNTVVAADITFSTLITAIVTAGGPTYDYRQINPVNGMDGGEPGGNIRVGFLFRTDRGVAFIDRPGAGSTTANSVVGSGAGTQLQYSPGRIDPTNVAFNASRKPLAGEFTYMGETFFVIANHFNSKGGDHPLFGRFQPPTLSSEVQRIQQAQIVNDFVDAILAANSAANVVVLGDINDFWFSNPMATLTAGGVLTPLITTLPANERYTYVFDGNSQDLDHILVSPNLFNNVPFVFNSVHVNAEFYDQDSDHDPQLAYFDYSAPAATLTGFTANGFTTITFNYSGSVPFTTDIYLSYNGVSQDVLLDSITITDPDGSQDFTLGTTIDLVNNANEVDVDYYLLADASGSTVLFQGVYHQSGSAVFVHGTDAADTITASGASAANVTVNLNGLPTNHNLNRGLRIRAHGGDDVVTMSGITFNSANIKPFVAGGPGTDALTGGNLQDTFLGGEGNDAIDGGNAANTASYLDSPASVVVDLTADTASDGWGDTDTFIKIGNAGGSAFNDTLIGDTGNNILGGFGGDDSIDGQSGNDRLLGGDGNDILDGDLGQDTAAYADSPAGVNASIPGGTASDGFGDTDSLISIERLDGSPFNDTLTGDGNPNVINGQNGHDIIIGGAGADTLQGQRGNDTIYANDTAVCTNDGAIDQLNGGPNNDTAYYTFAQDLPTAIENANDCP